MTDEEFIKKMKAFDFVERVEIDRGKWVIKVKDPFLSEDIGRIYEPKDLVCLREDDYFIKFNRNILKTIEPDKRKCFVKNVFDYLLSQKSMEQQKEPMIYSVVFKEDRSKRLVKNEKTNRFFIRLDDCWNCYKRYLTKQDLYEYQKQNNRKPLDEFIIYAVEQW